MRAGLLAQVGLGWPGFIRAQSRLLQAFRLQFFLLREALDGALCLTCGDSQLQVVL